jgi:putative RNA 2'-phosphotransferase
MQKENRSRGEEPSMADLTNTSKFLSLVLRHKPEEIGLVLDANSWADVDELIRLVNQHGKSLTRELLHRVVAENDKKRFAFSEDGLRIRASQGHSVEVDLALTPAIPPDVLFHGTAARFLDSIRATGLHSASRQHVHLSRDVETATKVGQRHGKPAILTVHAGAMHEAGHQFYLSANGVWLTDQVPVEFIEFNRE